MKRVNATQPIGATAILFERGREMRGLRVSDIKLFMAAIVL
jgi:hypothetical protein